MLTLASFIIVFVMFYQKRMLAHKNDLYEKEKIYQKQLLEAAVEVAEKEREKIAGNIHDDLGLALNAINHNNTKIKRNPNDTRLIAELLEANAELIEETITTIRSISHELMPASLVKLGFIRGISELCRQISLSGSTNVKMITNETVLNLNKKNELHLYRLIKEIINNILKHDGSSCIEVRIAAINQKLHIEIIHNGSGISNTEIKELIASNKGIGLKSIFSRAQLTNSQVNYFKNKNEAKVTIETLLL